MEAGQPKQPGDVASLRALKQLSRRLQSGLSAVRWGGGRWCPRRNSTAITTDYGSFYQQRPTMMWVWSLSFTSGGVADFDVFRTLLSAAAAVVNGKLTGLLDRLALRRGGNVAALPGVFSAICFSSFGPITLTWFNCSDTRNEPSLQSCVNSLRWHSSGRVPIDINAVQHVAGSHALVLFYFLPEHSLKS